MVDVYIIWDACTINTITSLIEQWIWQNQHQKHKPWIINWPKSGFWLVATGNCKVSSLALVYTFHPAILNWLLSLRKFYFNQKFASFMFISFCFDSQSAIVLVVGCTYRVDEKLKIVCSARISSQFPSSGCWSWSSLNRIGKGPKGQKPWFRRRIPNSSNFWHSFMYHMKASWRKTMLLWITFAQESKSSSNFWHSSAFRLFQIGLIWLED